MSNLMVLHSYCMLFLLGFTERSGPLPRISIKKLTNLGRVQTEELLLQGLNCYSSFVMASQTYYDLFGVSCDADEQEIRRAYRKKIQEQHPDQNPDDPGAMGHALRLNEARDILLDPIKRQQYDKKLQRKRSILDESAQDSENDPEVGAGTAEETTEIGNAWFKTFGDVFVRLIKMLISTTLALGGSAIGNPKKLRTLGAPTIGRMTLAIVIALAVGAAILWLLIDR